MSFDMDERVIAPNTKRTYDSLLKVYEEIMIKFDVEPFPCTPDKARGFLMYYKESHPKTTFGYLRQFVSAFSYRCRVIDNIDNFTVNNQRFRQFIKGLKNYMLGARCPHAKSPITPQIMEIMATNVDTDNLDQIQVMTISSFCFYGFLRISECLSLTPSDVHFDKDSNLMVIFIKSSKTDQEGRGVPIYVTKTSTSYSPFNWIDIYLQKVQIGSHLFSFSPQLFRSKLTQYLTGLGIDCENISTHSFRKGGAHAASCAGIPDSVIKAHGRWASMCFTRYTSIDMARAGSTITLKI